MKRLPLLAAVASLAAAAQPIAAQQKATTAPEAEPQSQDLTEVIVTGTRRADRTVQESAAPIDVLSGTDL
ncbi:MAG: hypothetical protein JO042_15740, partial [Sinobacteraceae bacterium]|nr:hypothetical protein [Nevskiaceae bacterium]